jgi:hypothetical protein
MGEAGNDRDRVAAVLWQDWDPIGVGWMGGPDDEYDLYAEGVVALLRSGAGEQAIADHLQAIEIERMGLPAKDVDAKRAARALVSLGIR